MNRWHEIWSKRVGTAVTDELTLADVMELDGFASGVGAVSEKPWRAFVERRAREMGVEPGFSVFEVGCGAGAFLRVLHEKGVRVAGLDYAAPLLAVAARSMPSGHWQTGEADQPLGEKTYDVVFANSVFHYFPNEAYAERVVRHMLKAARQCVAILDVPDTKLLAVDVANRQKAMGKQEYEQRYAGLHHLTRTPQWFQAFGGNEWTVTSSPQDIPGYGNNPYRFNVFLKRHATH